VLFMSWGGVGEAKSAPWLAQFSASVTPSGLDFHGERPDKEGFDDLPGDLVVWASGTGDETLRYDPVVQLDAMVAWVRELWSHRGRPPYRPTTEAWLDDWAPADQAAKRLGEWLALPWWERSLQDSPPEVMAYTGRRDCFIRLVPPVTDGYIRIHTDMGIGYTASRGMGTHMARVYTPATSTWTFEISGGDDESGVVIGSIRVSERNTGSVVVVRLDSTDVERVLQTESEAPFELSDDSHINMRTRAAFENTWGIRD